jgi:hypothetical protein
MSNTELTIPQTSKKQLEKVVGSDEDLEKFLYAQVSINNDGLYYESDCVVCSSQYRKESEEKWLDSRNADEIVTYFKDKGEPIPRSVVKNHMEFHIDQSYIELRKREYIKKVISMTNMHLDTISRVEMAMSAINDRIIAINASEEPASSPVAINKIKAETTCKLVSSMSSLLQLRANLLGEMAASGEVLTIKQEDFSSIFGDSLQKFNSESAREAINYILDKFVEAAKKQ